MRHSKKSPKKESQCKNDYYAMGRKEALNIFEKASTELITFIVMHSITVPMPKGTMGEFEDEFFDYFKHALPCKSEMVWVNLEADKISPPLYLWCLGWNNGIFEVRDRITFGVACNY